MAVDPGTIKIGYAVLTSETIEFDLIKAKETHKMIKRILTLNARINDIIDEYGIQTLILEEGITYGHRSHAAAHGLHAITYKLHELAFIKGLQTSGVHTGAVKSEVCCKERVEKELQKGKRRTRHLKKSDVIKDASVLYGLKKAEQQEDTVDALALLYAWVKRNGQH